MKCKPWASPLKTLAVLLLAMAMIPGTSNAEADAAVQYHCAGGLQLAGDALLNTLQKVLALPSTTNLENLAAARLSTLLCRRLGLESNASSATLLKPLLRNVVEEESLGSISGESSNAPSFILALHLDATRAQMWQDAFAKILGGSGEKLAAQDFSGQRWNRGGSNSLWLIPAQDWLLAGCGDGFASAEADFLSQIKSQGRPAPALKDNWLEADLSSRLLGGWFHLLKPARIHLAVAASGDNLKINGRVLEEEAIPWKAEPWQIPRELMRGPIISFTAGADVAAFLNLDAEFAHLAGNPLGHQFYFWALEQMPFLNYMAWPVENASNTFKNLCAAAPAVLNPWLKQFDGTELVSHPETAKLAWQNMRMLSPVLQPVQSDGGQFLLMSTLPVSTKGKTAPAPLLAEIQGRTNLVYYDWESTGRRLSELQFLSKIISNRSAAPSDQAEEAMSIESLWINHAVALLGNTVTEITRVSGNELDIERTAPLGFTGLELILLADWACDANSGPIHFPTPANMAPMPFPH